MNVGRPKWAKGTKNEIVRIAIAAGTIAEI
jgi:hypothetical protein